MPSENPPIELCVQRRLWSALSQHNSFFYIVRLFRQVSKSLIRLHECTVWSETLLRASAFKQSSLNRQYCKYFQHRNLIRWQELNNVVALGTEMVFVTPTRACRLLLTDRNYKLIEITWHLLPEVHLKLLTVQNYSTCFVAFACK